MYLLNMIEFIELLIYLVSCPDHTLSWGSADYWVVWAIPKYFSNL